MNHSDARLLVVQAFTAVIGRAPAASEAAFLQAIAWLETGYGSTWKGVGIGSFNMGAIQKGGWKGEVFEYTDTHPNADGTSTPYRIGFRKYPNATAGFEDLCRVVYVVFNTRKEALAAATRGDVQGFSTALHKYPCYYEGFGATDAERIAHHVKAVTGALNLQTAAGLPITNTVTGPSIAEVQHQLNNAISQSAEALAEFKAGRLLVVDGNMGPETEAAIRWFQKDRSLSITGVVDHATAEALGL